MKKYFLVLCLSISTLHAEETIQEPQIAIEQEVAQNTECVCEMCCCAEKESENSYAAKNPFEQLPQHSFVRKFCSENENAYHCEKLKIYLYCAQHWNNDFSKLDEKTLKEEVLCTYCSNPDNDWQFFINDSKYWHVSYQIKNIGEKEKKSSDTIIDETFLIIQHLEQLNEPVRNRVKQWQDQKDAEYLELQKKHTEELNKIG
jgi:hypothetical protein